MNEFDKKIIDASKIICEKIDNIKDEKMEILKPNVKTALRDLIEGVMQKIYSIDNDIELDNQSDKEKAIKYVKANDSLLFLNRFYKFVKSPISVSTADEENSFHLSSQYYEWLYKIREYVQKTFDIEILYNLEKNLTYKDVALQDYFSEIARKLDGIDYPLMKPNYRYYVLKSKAFYMDGNIYYEYTITPADDYSSKFKRFMVFSNREIPTFYSIKLSFIDIEINILNKNMPIKVIDDFKVAIRPAEFKNIAKILHDDPVDAGTKEYYLWMDYLTKTGITFSEILDLDQEAYDSLKERFIKNSNINRLLASFEGCRKLLQDKLPGHNIIRYLFLKLRNLEIKRQMDTWRNYSLSDLYVKYGCMAFEFLPFCTSLVQHNPSIYDVMLSIDSENHEHEILSRKIKNNIEQKVQLFTPLSDIKIENGDIHKLTEVFNSKLVNKHIPTRSLIIEDNMISINGYVSNTIFILEELLKNSNGGVVDYEKNMSKWLENNSEVDSEEKKKILTEMFISSKVALIYGAAGTGKTTLIRHIASYFCGHPKLFLTSTNPAKENLRRQIKVENCEFSTIASSKKLIEDNNYTIVFIDECSTVDNDAMKELLEKLSFKLLVLVGDVYQIESIKFGNWFGLAKYFLPQQSIFELTTPYRSSNKQLIDMWNKVRNLEGDISCILNENGYSSPLDESIFEREEEDEVVLCLNYDGIYGINNLNRFLQNKNPKEEIKWDTEIYKEDDPIIFTEHNRFNPVLYNNLKGWIRRIYRISDTLYFEVEVDTIITKAEAESVGLRLLWSSYYYKGHSLVRILVKRYIDDDENEKDENQVVPFQVAYAISIHKAQGSEYDSVKVVISNEVEEQITHNIFYTAITRARNKLKIFWSEDTQKNVLSSLKIVSAEKDAKILETKSELLKIIK